MFSRDHRTKTGYKVYCDNCDNKLSKEHKYSLWRELGKSVTANVMRANKAGLPADWNVEKWYAALYYFNFSCAVCGREDQRIVADHWINLTHENCPGTVEENMIPLCHGCNTVKTNHKGIEWAKRRVGKERAIEAYREILEFFKWCKKPRLWKDGVLKDPLD